MDDAALKFFEDNPFHKTLRILSTLLATIVVTSEGKLDPKYEKISSAKALLHEYPSLVDKLKEAWEAKTSILDRRWMISDAVIELLRNSELTSLIFVAVLIFPKVTNRIPQRLDCTNTM